MKRAPLASRISCMRASALGLAAAIMLVPANLLPVLSTNVSGRARTDTIFSGTVELCNNGLWALAVIVFAASILIPFLKLVGLGWLLHAVRRRTDDERARRLTRLYRILDFVGRWSMLDVFLAAFLVGIVRFGRLASIHPRPGLLAFAAAVVLTMLATHAFDPRMLWTKTEPAQPTP